MLRPTIASLLAAVLLVACQMAAPGGSPITGDEISVTALPPLASEGAVETTVATAAAAGDDTVHPKPRPGAEPVTADPVTSEPETTPEVVKPPEQLLCEKAGGQWAVAGLTGAYICIKPTRDGGKMCRKKGDCEGLCLARSGTCAPFAPLFGCNEVLEKDGRRVTLCID